MTKKRVELHGVSKHFEDVIAVDGIDLDVEPGEFLALLGPSGCGKTTTLRMIAGLEVPTDGLIRIGDVDVTEMLPQDRDLSMVFQNYALYPHKTVEENLRFPLGKMDLTDEEADEKVTFVSELLDIEEHLKKKPSQLSGGQRQRVALGRTIIREPGVFLMDEPLSNLDAELRVSTRAELRILQQELGTTTVYVTHDQEEAMSVADRIVIMDGGEIQQIGTPKDVYTNPKNAFVASFLGDPGINFLPVHTSSENGLRIDVGEGADLEVRVTGEREPDQIGIRPQDIFLGGDHQQTTERLSEPLEMRVETIDPLGHGYELVLEEGNVTITALVDEPVGRIGDRIGVSFDIEHCHVFAADGTALTVER